MKTNSQNKQNEIQLNDITLKLHHNEMRDCPEEMLLALYRYTKGYHKIVELIGSQIEPETHCVFQFDYVQRGLCRIKK